MSGYAFSSVDELGEGFGFRKVRGALGVTAFGVNAIVYPAGLRRLQALARPAGRALLRPPRAGARRGRRRGAGARRGRPVPRRVDDPAARCPTRARRRISSCWLSAARAATSSATGISSTWSTICRGDRALAASGPSVEDLEHSRYFLTEWMPPLLRETAERLAAARARGSRRGRRRDVVAAGSRGPRRRDDLCGRHLCGARRAVRAAVAEGAGDRVRRRACRRAGGRFRRCRHLVAGDRASAGRPRARTRNRAAAQAGRVVLCRERDPRAACVLALQGKAAGARAVAARSDAHARVRIGGSTSARCSSIQSWSSTSCARRN